jgi:UDP-N-acetylglucosamine 2-epimerase (non-hydrolysing)
MLAEFKISIPENVVMTDPIGYLELLELMAASKAVLTDSGTIVEEAAIIGIPSIQMRTATERPQVYACGASVKFDPFIENEYEMIFGKLRGVSDAKWEHPFGDGKASYRIVDDLIMRLKNRSFSGHNPEKYEPYSLNSYRA